MSVLAGKNDFFIHLLASFVYFWSSYIYSLNQLLIIFHMYFIYLVFHWCRQSSVHTSFSCIEKCRVRKINVFIHCQILFTFVIGTSDGSRSGHCFLFSPPVPKHICHGHRASFLPHLQN